MLSGALSALRRAAAYHNILNAPPNQAIHLRRAARPALAAALAQDIAAPTLILTAQPARAREWEAQLPSWSSAPVFRFATPTARPYERVGRNGPSAQKRLAALVALIPTSPAPAPHPHRFRQRADDAHAAARPLPRRCPAHRPG